MRNCTIAARQALMAAALIVVMAAVGALAMRALFSADERLRANHAVYTVPLVDLGALLSEVQHARGLLAAGLGGENSAVSDGYYQQVKPTQDRIAQAWSSFKAAAGDEGASAVQVQRIDAALTASRQAEDKVLALARAGSFEDAMDLMRGDSARRFEALRAAVIDAMNDRRSAAQSAFQDAVAANATARGLVMGLLGIGLVLGVVMTVLAVRKVRALLSESIAIAQAVAAGDLSIEIGVEGNDETARLRAALRDMQAALVTLVAKVKVNAQSVTHGSTEIAAGNLDLSSRTEMQASALQQTAASMEQLSATVRLNADHARQASQLASGSSAIAVRGGEVVGQVVSTMKGINDSSRRIADITAVIDGIAFQTNILALNAAVEAARAGEQGRGFAVVAAEVRNLAQRSAQAAKEIKALIAASVERVEQGTVLVDEAGSTMAEVVASIRRVADIVGEISSASAEQHSGVAQVGQAITQMDEATQRNAALVEQSAAAAESLKQQAQQLVDAVSVFRLRQA